MFNGKTKRLNIERLSTKIEQTEHRTSYDEIARAAQALAPRVASPVIKKPEYLIQNSMLDVGCSMFIAP